MFQHSLLFQHSLSPCNSWLRHNFSPLWHRKGASLKKFNASSEFHEQANVDESLNSLWYKLFCEKVASNTSHINPRSLPRTAAASKCHSLRVFLQIHQWKGYTEKLNPEQWGWKNSDGRLIPVQTDLPPAPDELLRIIKCN